MGKGKKEKAKAVSAHDSWVVDFWIFGFLGTWSSDLGRYQHRQSGHARSLLVESALSIFYRSKKIPLV